MVVSSLNKQSLTYNGTGSIKSSESFVARKDGRYRTGLVVPCRTRVGVNLPSGVLMDWHTREISARRSSQYLCVKPALANFLNCAVFPGSWSIIGIRSWFGLAYLFAGLRFTVKRHSARMGFGEMEGTLS